MYVKINGFGQYEVVVSVDEEVAIQKIAKRWNLTNEEIIEAMLIHGYKYYRLKD